MGHSQERCTNMLRTLALSTFALIITLAPSYAQKQPKTYPEEGKVNGTGLSQWSRYTYKVETDTKVYVFECEKIPRPGLSSYTPRECGGFKKIQIGDVIHFRNEKGWVYMQVTESDSRPHEEKLRILSQELKPAAKQADKTSATSLEKTDAKPADPKE